MKAQSQIVIRCNALLKRADALTLRERMLVFVTVLVLAGSIWHMLFMQPLLLKADAARAEITAVQARIAAANQSLEDQVLQLAQSGSEQRTRYALIRHRMDEIDAALGEFSGELVDPAEMAFVLERVLKSQSGLRLMHIRNLDAEPLPADEEGSPPVLYRHALEIEVEGSYFDALAYLDQIEALPWRLYWQFLDIEVLDYPRNRIRIEVSTMSLDEEWIGA